MLRLVATRRTLCTSVAVPTTPPAITSRVQQIFEDYSATSGLADNDTKFKVLAACEKGLGFGIPHSHLNHLNSMEEVARYFHWRVEEVAREKAAHEAHWTHNLPPNVSLQGVPEKKLRALSAWEADGAAESKNAPRQDE